MKKPGKSLKALAQKVRMGFATGAEVDEFERLEASVSAKAILPIVKKSDGKALALKTQRPLSAALNVP